MADPDPYVVDYDFTAWQAANPTLPLPADEVDSELAAIAAATVEAVDAIKDVRRSDGALKNGIVTVDSLDATVAAGVGSGALAAQEAAEAAQTAAEEAQGLAETAQTAAETAQGHAETAETNAETAETNAEAAATAAAASLSAAGLPDPAVADTVLVRNPGNTAYLAKSAAETRTFLAVQPLDAMLTALAALTSADNKALAFSGADVPVLIDFMRAAGSWTPGISSSGGAVTPGTVTANGVYWKLGNLVIAPFQYFNATVSGGSGNLLFTGLPHTIINTSTPVDFLGFIQKAGNFNTGASPVNLGLQGIPNTTTFTVIESFDNSAFATTQIGAWGANSEIVGCLIYRSAA